MGLTISNLNYHLVLKCTHYGLPAERIVELSAVWDNLVESQHPQFCQQSEINLFGRKIEKSHQLTDWLTDWLTETASSCELSTGLRNLNSMLIQMELWYSMRTRWSRLTTWKKSEKEAQPRTETKEEEPAKSSVMKRENFSRSERSNIKCSSNFQ